MSFASEPGRDDYNLPPVNVVVPDDARELDRDVLAYQRELRSVRRQQRLGRLSRPLRLVAFGGRAAIVPLIAVCLAVSLVGGALLSVASMSPAAAPTLSSPPASESGVTGTLPAGDVERDGIAVPANSLVTSAIALIPAGCDCGPSLKRLAGQAKAVGVHVYFAALGQAIPQAATLTAAYGAGTAITVTDNRATLSNAYHNPARLTVLLVYRDATARVLAALPSQPLLTTDLSKLGQPGPRLGAVPGTS